MSATRLLVLAFVRAHRRAHGYLVGQELLAWDAAKWANTKTGSIYHALRQLSKEGLLAEFDVPATEAAPARTDYSITPAGDQEFHKLMETALSTPQIRPDMLCAGLVLMSALPRADVLKYLRAMQATIGQHQADVHKASETLVSGEQVLPPHAEVLVSYWSATTASSAAWLSHLIGKIEGGAYIFADENKRAFGTPGVTLSAP